MLAPPRLTVSDIPGGVQIVAPAPRNWGAVLVLPVWLCMWIFAVIKIAPALKIVSSAGTLFPLIWLALWIFAGLAALYTFLWALVGREILTVRYDRLALRAEVFGVGRSTEFNLNEVRRFRCERVLYTLWSFRQSRPQRNAMPGRIAFDCLDRTYAFGAGLTDAKAAYLAAEIRRRYQIPD